MLCCEQISISLRTKSSLSCARSHQGLLAGAVHLQASLQLLDLLALSAIQLKHNLFSCNLVWVFQNVKEALQTMGEST